MAEINEEEGSHLPKWVLLVRELWNEENRKKSR